MMRSLLVLAGLGTVAGLAACSTPEVSQGRSDYLTYCAGCHGDDAMGDGPAAKNFAVTPPDLTLISSRYGGFPTVEVMSQIDGYSRGTEAMPAFGAELVNSPTVLVDTGDGVQTPTPSRLYDLALYLKSIQR